MLFAFGVRIYASIDATTITYVSTQMTEHDQISNDVLRRVEALERAQDECTQNLRHMSELEQQLQDAFMRIEEAEKFIKKLEQERLKRDATEEKSQYASLDQQRVLVTKSKIRKSERRLKRLVELMPEESDVNYMDIIRENGAVSKNQSGNPKMKGYTFTQRNLSVSVKFEQAQNIKKTVFPRRAAGSLTETEVAFSVSMASVGNVFQSNQILTYDTVLYNKGNAYNPKMGTFVCPVTGTYYFFANVGAQPDTSVSISVKLDGLLKGRAIAVSSSGVYEQGSTAVCAKCDMGQNVYVEAYQNAAVYGDYYTSFSGFLISREETISS